MLVTMSSGTGVFVAKSSGMVGVRAAERGVRDGVDGKALMVADGDIVLAGESVGAADSVVAGSVRAAVRAEATVEESAAVA